MRRRSLLPFCLNRRSALGAIGAAAAALSLSRQVGHATTQEVPPDAMARYLIVGVWIVATPTGLALPVFSADGTTIQSVPTA
jgi:hypothetical protein